MSARVLALVGLSVLMIARPQQFAEWQGSSDRAPNLLHQSVPSFRAHGVTLVDALLDLGRVRNQPLGVESLDTEAVTRTLDIDFAGGTFDEAIRAVTAGRKGYSWSVQDGVIVITRAAVPSGTRSLLDRVLPRLALPQCRLQEANHLLFLTLYADMYPRGGIAGDYDPGRTATLVGPVEMKHVSVRAALNRIVSQAGHAAWVARVPPRQMGELPSSGLWEIVDYRDQWMQDHVGPMLRHEIDPPAGVRVPPFPH